VISLNLVLAGLRLGLKNCQVGEKWALENLSDERVVLQFKRNPYYQYFCGYSNYMPGMPCNATELVHFRLVIRVALKLQNNTLIREVF
jgi:hypothetical protein